MKPRFLLPFLFASLPAASPSQDLMVPLLSAPSGYGSDRDWLPPTAAESLSGWSFGAGTGLTYDSNSNPGPNGSSDSGDTIWTVSTSAAYRTRGTEWSLGARAALDHALYFSDSDLGGFGYNGGLDFGYNGGPLAVLGTFGYSFDQGVNRLYGGYLESHRFNTGLSASYQISPKTSLTSRFGYNWTDPEEGDFTKTEQTTFDIAALWRVSPLLSVGPGFAYNYTTGDTQQGRTGYGPIVRAQYRLGAKIALDGTMGVEFVDYDGAGGTDTSFTTGLGISYQASPLWGMNLGIYRGTVADGAVAGAYRESLAVRMGYNRQIRRASLNLGLGYETNTTRYPSGLDTGVDGAGDFITFDASLGMPVFQNRVLASTFFNWREEVDGNSLYDTDGYQIGVRLSTGF
jgi:hypothetical protein